MRKFISQLGIALVLFCLICIIVLQIDGSKYRFFQLEEDFAKSSWISNNLLDNPGLKIDHLFIGSSLVFTNADDSMLSVNHPEVKVINAAIPGDGRNLQYVTLKKTLSLHQVEKVYIELRNLESRAGHQHFGVLADGEDLLRAPILMNFSYFKDLKYGLKYRIRYILNIVLGVRTDETEWSTRPYGRHAFWRMPDSAKLERERIHLEALRGRRYLGESLEAFEHRMSMIYLEKMLDLCHEKEINVAFLYQPVFKEERKIPLSFREFSEIELIQPPESLLSNPSYWADPYHLNVKGMAIYTAWLESQIL